MPSSRYFEAVGRRKTAVARVRLTPKKKGGFVVNDKSLDEYFASTLQLTKALESLQKAGLFDSYAVSVRVLGGGLTAQAEAIRHGVTRALVKHEPELRKLLKKEGYLKRDPRVKERKKFGLKKARRAPQWSKR